MPSPLRNKNSIEKAAFELTEAGFLYNGSLYRHDDVKIATRIRQRFELRHLGVGSDFTHSISIRFEMESGQVVQLTEQPTLTSEGNPANVDKIEGIFSLVCEKSFLNRIKNYYDQVNAGGCFSYDDWIFYPKERYIKNQSTGQSFNLDSIVLLKSYGYLEIRKKNEGLLAKVGRNISGKTQIHTLKNTDVFFTLMKHLFRLEWAGGD